MFRDGILYPQTNYSLSRSNHSKIITDYFLYKSDKLNNFLKENSHIANKNKIQSIIISGEGISNLNRSQIEILRELIFKYFHEYILHFVLYLRHPYTWGSSKVQHLCKWSDANLFEIIKNYKTISYRDLTEKFMFRDGSILSVLEFEKQITKPSSLCKYLIKLAGYTKFPKYLLNEITVRNSLSFNSLLKLDLLKQLNIIESYDELNNKDFDNEGPPFFFPPKLFSRHFDKSNDDLVYIKKKYNISYCDDYSFLENKMEINDFSFSIEDSTRLLSKKLDNSNELKRIKVLKEKYLEKVRSLYL